MKNRIIERVKLNLNAAQQMTDAEKREQQYQTEFREFGYKNPSVDELDYIKRMIKRIKLILADCEETADDTLGEELDGTEVINGNLIITKTGTSSDLAYWEKELAFLKEKKQFLKNPEQIGEAAQVNPFPSVFINLEVYECFIEYTKKHIIDFYTDYSYLKKRLEYEKLIHKHSDIDFMKFLKNDIKLIKDKQEQTFVSKESKFNSLGKSKSEQRINNFNNVFEGLF